MAGQLTIDTLKASSGVLATQNGMTGIAKAWLNYNGSTQTLNNSFNVSSVTYNSTGNYTVNFTTAIPNSTYAVAFGGYEYTSSGVLSQATTSFTFNTVAPNNAANVNRTIVQAVVFSS